MPKFDTKINNLKSARFKSQRKKNVSIYLFSAMCTFGWQTNVQLLDARLPLIVITSGGGGGGSSVSGSLVIEPEPVPGHEGRDLHPALAQHIAQRSQDSRVLVAIVETAQDKSSYYYKTCQV